MGGRGGVCNAVGVEAADVKEGNSCDCGRDHAIKPLTSARMDIGDQGWVRRAICLTGVTRGYLVAQWFLPYVKAGLIVILFHLTNKYNL